MTNTIPKHITEDYWTKIQIGLAVSFWKIWSSKKDWHIFHWMRDYGEDFFRFFKEERRYRPDRLIAWWNEQQGAPPQQLGVLPIRNISSEIARAWSDYPKHAIAEAA